MNATPAVSTPRRRVWRWVFIGLGLCLAPFVILALVAASFLTLDRDAAALRRQVMAATDTGWHTKVQLSVGHLTLAVLQTGLAFVHHKDIGDARLALAAVRRASVGVYQRSAGPAGWSREQLFADSDRTMHQRGWSRLVGVADGKDTVLIYMPDNAAADERVDLCLAVLSGEELVVVATSVDAAKLLELVEKRTPADLQARLHLANLRL